MKVIDKNHWSSTPMSIADYVMGELTESDRQTGKIEYMEDTLDRVVHMLSYLIALLVRAGLVDADGLATLLPETWIDLELVEEDSHEPNTE